jgi:hypothetical protein
MRPGRGIDDPPASSFGVKEREELYVPLWAFVVGCRVNFTFIFTFTCKKTDSIRVEMVLGILAVGPPPCCSYW